MNHEQSESAPEIASQTEIETNTATRTSRLELTVAVSAIIISFASFWLAWQQTRAMDAQVKAMTWPYLQLRSGNYDVDARERAVSLTLENAGVGPTRVAWLALSFDGVPVGNIVDYAIACCGDSDQSAPDRIGRNTLTGDASPALISAGEQQLIFRMPFSDDFAELWQEFDRARWKLTASACHCSILDQCFVTDFESEPRSVKSCPEPPSPDWQG